MTDQCKIEFYFKRADLEKLLNTHKGAIGFIISQEISKEKPKGMDHYVNIAHIRARPDLLGHVQKSATVSGEDEFIDGCPYPPGCTV